MHTPHEPVEKLPALPARFPGRCPLCELSIDVDELIVNLDGDWCHAYCADIRGHDIAGEPVLSNA